MAGKEVRFRDDARQRMFKGANILANGVEAPLGPKGRPPVLEKTYRAPVTATYVVSVAWQTGGGGTRPEQRARGGRRHAVRPRLSLPLLHQPAAQSDGRVRKAVDSLVR